SGGVYRKPTGEILLILTMLRRSSSGELRLPNFYYGCGVLGHILRDCEHQLEESERRKVEELPYGPWLRGSREVRFGYMGWGSAPSGGWFSQNLVSMRSCDSGERRDTTSGGGNRRGACEDDGGRNESFGQRDIVGTWGGSTTKLGRIRIPNVCECRHSQGRGIGIGSNLHWRGGAPPTLVLGATPRVRGAKRVSAAKEGAVKRAVTADGMEIHLTAKLLSFSTNHIDVHVNSAGDSANWQFTGFYGEADTARRKNVWHQLAQLSKQSDAAWICAGDYNEILHPSEKTGAQRPIWQMEDFCRALTRSDLSDLGFQGAPYTWCNRRQHPDTVWARLDRACGNTQWLSKFSSASVVHKATPYSDHAMLVISWTRDRGKSRVRHPNLRVWRKIQATRVQLLRWRRSKGSSPPAQRKELEERFETLQSGRLDQRSYAELGRIR
ncbi:UNVERIFIED_CONTAM: hypothetical protein Slati_2357500, partial [Sesamum latifolium]